MRSVILAALLLMAPLANVAAFGPAQQQRRKLNLLQQHTFGGNGGVSTLPRNPQRFIENTHMLKSDRPFVLSSTRLQASSENMEEGDEREDEDGWTEKDDDGWGSQSGDGDSKKALLRTLQIERQEPGRKADQSATSLQTAGGEERDLFIPVFALVSLAGLFGAYGYEMLRLASRGELYLPWQN